MDNQSSLTRDPWTQLRQLTPGRIALGRAGGSMPTRALLDFRMAHARARDAVSLDFDPVSLTREIEKLGINSIILQSSVSDRKTYLHRPDLGRRLNERSCTLLKKRNIQDQDVDLAIIISDGLSALAVQHQAIPFLKVFLPLVNCERWNLSPIIIVKYGRVALEDEIGSLINAKVALMLIGERPGLGSPDSLGAYLVYGPKIGNTDANRNCVSNIRSEGLVHPVAAEKVRYLIREALQRKMSGVLLKDESIDPSILLQRPANKRHLEIKL